MSYLFMQGDVTRIPLPDRSVDLVLGSPPYCDARTYGIGAQRKCAEWVGWMLAATAEALRVSKGCVVWVAAGVTRDRNYWPACEGLMWEWWRRGGHAYRPVYWHRVGIPGSGGDEWFRADVEYCMAFKRPGKLPWTDNTACGHPPKWAPGGAMSNRLSDGRRVNQWGGTEVSSSQRRANGERQKSGRPSHRTHTKTRADGEWETQGYNVPTLANPGNLLKTIVGGNQMGHPLAHENEAPFPEELARFFVRSLCPPGGLCLDPFSGSGTTASVALQEGRHAVGADLRMSQAQLGRRRVSEQLERPHRADMSAPAVKPLPGQMSFLDAPEPARTP